jgi:hypothetical protein
MTSKAHMQVHKNRESREKQQGKKPGPNWAETGPGWSAQAGRPSPFRARFGAPFDLAANRTIYNPLAKTQVPHINSFIIRRRGAEKLEGHHLGEEGRASCLGSP